MVLNKKLHKNEALRYRILFLIAIIAYPAWGLLTEAFVPQAYDPFWQRLFISGVVCSILMASYFAKSKIQFLEKGAIVSGWILFVHAFAISWASHMPYHLFAGLLVFICCFLNVLPSKKSSWFFAMGTAIAGLSIFSVDNSWEVHPFVANACIWSAIVPSLYANFTRLGHLNSLNDLQKKMEILFLNMKEGLIVFGPNSKVKVVNEAASQILGYTEDQMLESNPFEFASQWVSEDGKIIPPQEHPVAWALDSKVEIKDVIIGFAKDDGSIIWMMLSASPLQETPAASQFSTIVTFSDITEFKRSQKIIFEQQSRLEASAKLTAMGEMAGGIAHEINNPLAIILGRVFIIRKAILNNKMEQVDSSLETITSTVHRMQKIVKGLQAFSAGGGHDPFVKVNLKQIVDESVTYCQEVLDKNQVRIELEVGEEIELECRAIQLSQVFINLIQNSCDAIEQQNDRWIRIWARTAHDVLVLTVTDSGPGIPPEIQKKLMQPFFTTKEVGKGTGLGLSITKGLVNSHRGRFWLNSSAPHTTFVIELPLRQQANDSAA